MTAVGVAYVTGFFSSYFKPPYFDSTSYPNFEWPYPTPPSTGIQLVAVGSDAPHWTGQHQLSQMAYGAASKDGGGVGSTGGGSAGGGT